MENENVNLGAGAVADENLNQPENRGEQKTYNQEELNKILQSETDKRVNQALENFKTKDLPNLLNKEKQEAERLATMSAEQKAEHKRKQQEESLQQRETEITRKELRIEAHKILTEKGLPVELLDILPYDSADSCNQGIESTEKAFRQAVESGIKERLRGEPPKVGEANKAPKSVSELMREANAHPERMAEILSQIGHK